MQQFNMNRHLQPKPFGYAEKSLTEAKAEDNMINIGCKENKVYLKMATRGKERPLGGEKSGLSLKRRAAHSTSLNKLE